MRPLPGRDRIDLWTCSAFVSRRRRRRSVCVFVARVHKRNEHYDVLPTDIRQFLAPRGPVRRFLKRRNSRKRAFATRSVTRRSTTATPNTMTSTAVEVAAAAITSLVFLGVVDTNHGGDFMDQYDQYYPTLFYRDHRQYLISRIDHRHQYFCDCRYVVGRVYYVCGLAAMALLCIQCVRPIDLDISIYISVQACSVYRGFPEMLVYVRAVGHSPRFRYTQNVLR